MAALFQRAQGLGERPLQPGEVVGLAVMVRRELVGPPDRGVPYVFAGTLDQRSHIAGAFRVGHRPVAAAGRSGRAGPGPDTLWTLAGALDDLVAVLAGTLEPAARAIVPAAYW
jgi:hypothetical protein